MSLWNILAYFIVLKMVRWIYPIIVVNGKSVELPSTAIIASSSVVLKLGFDLQDFNLFFANIRNHKLNAVSYLCDVFRRIKKTTKEELVNLLPHKWQPMTV